MKKILLTLLLSLFCISIKAQLDTEHWFAPMFNRNSSSNYYASSSSQYIFLSTNETTPFDVEIYSGNKLLTTIKGLKKGTPKSYSIAQKYIISKDFYDLGTPINKGLYLKGSKKFFANLRFSTYNHAEILTSKGQAGIGNKFYAVVTPILLEADILNFSIGILATEDNTKVKFSGYHPQVRFSNVNPNQSIEITLNKGQSYILEGNAYGYNKTGAIGMKIEADKPISVTNGNFNGQYISSGRGSDIIMDQSVPVDRLGNEFAIIKGNGQIGDRMEGAIIVATENNTAIYLNDETNPITILNEGEYYIIPDDKFMYRGNNHYNLYIKSTKNIYLYQMLAGVPSSSATAGFNYIPPLSCFLPTQVGEIGMINTMYGEGHQGEYTTIPTKLNFITMRGAIVNVDNYVLTPNNGPFDVAGTTEWVTYSIPNVKGNINITSTKSITAGISAGDFAVGYGGYFAGFSTIESIKKKGDCIPNITLEIEGSYDTYQWKRNGVDIVGANDKVYNPTEPGYYSVKIGNANCSQITAEIKVLNCLVETNIEANICGVRKFTPVFTKSKQSIDLSTLKIIDQPKKGTISIDTNTGQIIYTPYVGQTGTDFFSYQFSGKDTDFPDSEKVTATIQLGGFTLKNATLMACKENGTGIFNLTSASIGDATGYTIKYYPTLLDAQNNTNEIANPTAYSSNGGKVYVKADSKDGCSGEIEISLEFYSQPEVKISNYNASHCDTDFDGKVDIDFSQITAAITTPDNIVKYYLSQEAAQKGDTSNLPNNWSYSNDKEVYARVISPNGCFIIEKIDFKVKDRLKLLKENHTESICNTNSDTKIKANLADYLSNFTDNKLVKATYYTNLSDAHNQVNAVGEQVLVNHGNIYYIRLEDGVSCANIAQLEFDIKTPLKKTILKECPQNGRAVFDLTSADLGNTHQYPLKYYPTETDRTNDTNEITNPASYLSSGGVVYVKALTDRICENTGEIHLQLASIPSVNIGNYLATHCDTDFDGKVDIDFSKVTAAITTPNNSVKYYLSQSDAERGSNNNLPNKWSYTTNNTEVYVRVTSSDGCSVVNKIIFEIKEKLPLNTTEAAETLCDTDLDGVIAVNLADYHHLFTSEKVSGTYYINSEDAKNRVNPIHSQREIRDGETYYFRLENATSCPNIAKLTFKVNVPNASSLLKDIAICATDTTNLDAGGGFLAYHWSTGETTQNINAGLGEYWVDLTSANGCVYRQYVKINKIEAPKIESIDIKEDVAIVNVTGGTAPYEYSLNGSGWQSSNIFSHLVKGMKYNIAVRAQNGCEIVYQDFSIIKLVNFITPNEDGVNDVIDYSELKTKANAKFHIYDRYGALVFKGDNSNQFIWDGKAKGRPLPTAAYWYLIEWQEPHTNTWVKTSSWILLKNRD